MKLIIDVKSTWENFPAVTFVYGGERCGIIIIIIINVHLETLYIVQLYHSVYKK